MCPIECVDTDCAFLIFPSDKRGSETFVTLSAQLLEELPRFLGQVSRYFNIIIAAFASCQASYVVCSYL